MSERIKIGLVGCGGMGRRHLRGIASLCASSFSNVELAAVCDLNQDNANFLADEAAELLGARPRVFADIAAMAREIPDLQAASVTTDAGSHHTVGVACLEVGMAEGEPEAIARALIERADELLYDAKENGRNRVIAVRHSGEGRNP